MRASIRWRTLTMWTLVALSASSTLLGLSTIWWAFGFVHHSPSVTVTYCEVSMGRMLIERPGEYLEPGFWGKRRSPLFYPDALWRFSFQCRAIPGSTVRDLLIELPLWAPALGAGIPALWMLRRRRLAARTRAGLCPNCGYDRRGLPSATAPCPECGAAPE